MVEAARHVGDRVCRVERLLVADKTPDPQIGADALRVVGCFAQRGLVGQKARAGDHAFGAEQVAEIAGGVGVEGDILRLAFVV